MRAFASFLLIPLVLATALPAAAAVSVNDAADWPMTPYNCAGGEGLDVRFSPDGEYATIDQMEERILMQLVPSASGARYKAMHGAYSYQLDTKGEEATLYEAGDKVVLGDCVTGGE